MKTYRITSENFVHQGETGDADAVMDPSDLRELKRLAGIPVLEAEAGIYTGQGMTNTDNGPSMSPVGSVVSKPEEDRRQLEREYNAKPGTDLWFIINFTKPYLNGSVRSQVEKYLEKHPEYRVKPLPGG